MSIIFWQHGLIFTQPSISQRIKCSSEGACFYILQNKCFLLYENPFCWIKRPPGRNGLKWLKEPFLSLPFKWAMTFSHKTGSRYGSQMAFSLRFCEGVGNACLSPFFFLTSFMANHPRKKTPGSHRNPSKVKTRPSCTVYFLTLGIDLASASSRGGGTVLS